MWGAKEFPKGAAERRGCVCNYIDQQFVINITSPLCGSVNGTGPIPHIPLTLHVGLNMTPPLRGYINPKINHSRRVYQNSDAPSYLART